ncbi:META domain-containing protein [Pannonibacter tanglangensis]|nr:META domain-containing protein [Pannonibacter sp. XCT-34]
MREFGIPGAQPAVARQSGPVSTARGKALALSRCDARSDRLSPLARLVGMSLPIALAIVMSLSFGAKADEPALPFDLVGKWLAEDIGGKGVIDTAQTILEIEEAGTVSGSTGCNTVFGQVTQGAGLLKIGPLALTRKACAPAVMDQERKFVDAINATVDYRSERGKLILLNAKAETVAVLTLM